MTVEDMAVLAVAATTVIGSFIGSVRWLVKHYLNELKPNSGSSLRDEVTALSVRVETIINFLLVAVLSITITLLVIFCIIKFLLDQTEDK